MSLVSQNARHGSAETTVDYSDRQGEMQDTNASVSPTSMLVPDDPQDPQASVDPQGVSISKVEKDPNDLKALID